MKMISMMDPKISIKVTKAKWRKYRVKWIKAWVVSNKHQAGRYKWMIKIKIMPNQ